MSSLAQVLGAQAALAALAAGVRSSTVELRVGRAQHGAGIAWGDGLVLSNAHVATAEEAEVVRADGSAVRARLVARDPVRDLALLAAPRLGLPPVSLGRADRLRPGMLVFALGHPLGVVGALRAGVVHSVGPAVSRLRPPGAMRKLPWLELDLEVAPGNSGGPVLDAAGEVVGITTMIVAGLALAVPGEAALRWATRREHEWLRSAS